MQIGDFLNQLKKTKSVKGGWTALCPAHNDKSPSLSVKEGDDGRILLHCHAGCPTEAVADALGMALSDLFVESKTSGNQWEIEATYDYRDEARKLLFQAVRYIGKKFSQRKPDGVGGWIKNLDGVRRVLYRLPELAATDKSSIVFIPEGEKDVDRLRAGGLVATCNAMGAGSEKNNFNWRSEYNEFLRGRPVVILPDNDQSGRDHAQAIAKSLRGVASSVKMLALSGLPEKGDVSDWLSLGGTVETLRAMAEAAPEWTPDAEQPKAARVAVSWGDLCEMKIQRRETVLHEVERGEIVMCPAITNKGKTTYWRNAAISFACGLEFDPIVKAGAPRAVLYLDFETRLYRARADIMKMLGRLEQSERALISTNFHIVADCRINGRPLTLSDSNHLEIIEAEAQRVKADLIIIDTLTAAFEVENENDNAEAARIMKKLTGLALRLDCVIVFLHHVGKAKQEEGQTAQPVHRARGASAYSGFSHAIFSLLPHTSDPDLSTLECAKVKGEKFVDRTIKLNPETRWFANLGEAEKPPTLQKQVVGIFNGKPLKIGEIKKQFPKFSGRAIEEALKAALKAGELFQPSRGFYQKPDSTFTTGPIGDVENVESTQPDDSEEFNLDSLDWPENDECGNSDRDFYSGEEGDECPF